MAVGVQSTPGSPAGNPWLHRCSDRRGCTCRTFVAGAIARAGLAVVWVVRQSLRPATAHEHQSIQMAFGEPVWFWRFVSRFIELPLSFQPCCSSRIFMGWRSSVRWLMWAWKRSSRSNASSRSQQSVPIRRTLFKRASSPRRRLLARTDFP